MRFFEGDARGIDTRPLVSSSLDEEAFLGGTYSKKKNISTQKHMKSVSNETNLGKRPFPNEY